MIRGLYSAARAMAVESKKQEVISNNLANVDTTGFKRDMLIVMSEAGTVFRNDKSGRVPVGDLLKSPLVEMVATNFAPGMLEETGRTLDVAILGDSFFVLQTPEGLRFTRDGSFSLDGEGYLVGAGGGYVLGADGQRIQLPGDQVRIDEEGGIWNKADDSFLGRLGLADFSPEALQGLEKRGHNMFEATGLQPEFPGNGRVRQGFLEKANLDLVREMVDMMSVLRTYEANQRMLQAQDEVLGKSVNEVGRVR